jgi:hypothetical protein
VKLGAFYAQTDDNVEMAPSRRSELQ